jgi:hypothetical protein
LASYGVTAQAWLFRGNNEAENRLSHVLVSARFTTLMVVGYPMTPSPMFF